MAGKTIIGEMAIGEIILHRHSALYADWEVKTVKDKNALSIRIVQSSAAHIAAGFICMGAWAVFANYSHGWPEALKAGLVQGCMTAVITLVMKKAIEAVSAGFAARGHKTAALIATPFITCGVSLFILFTGHSLAQTPELWATIAIPFGVAFGYACLYSYGLHRLRTPS